MTDSFASKMQELSDRVGHGDLIGSVKVNQIYAQYQHEGLELNHPRGGQAKYLEQPLLDNKDHYLESVAKTVLDDGGQQGMIDSMEDLAGDGGVATHAPILFGFLRKSGHPSVTSDGKTVFDKPAEATRQSEEELRAQARAIPLPAALLGWIWWHVEGHTSPPPRRG